MKPHIPLQLLVICMSAVGACQKGKYPPTEHEPNPVYWMALPTNAKHIQLKSAFVAEVGNGSQNRLSASIQVHQQWHNDTLVLSHHQIGGEVRLRLELKALHSLISRHGSQVQLALHQSSDTVNVVFEGGIHLLQTRVKALHLSMKKCSVHAKGAVTDFRCRSGQGAQLMAFDMNNLFLQAFADEASLQYLYAPHYLNANSCDSSEIIYRGNPATELLSTCRGGKIRNYHGIH